MIHLYTASTPNGHKVSCLLEALEMPYEVHSVNLAEGEQKKPEFLKISPNGRIPAIVDTDNDGLSIFESGAIMLYLADKAGKLIPDDLKGRAKVTEWLMFQMGGIGPMMGQANVFYRYLDDKIDVAINRYHKECRRLFEVLDNHLKDNQFLVNDFSIADIANWCWIRTYKWSGINFENLPHLERWMKEIYSIKGMSEGLDVPLSQEELKKYYQSKIAQSGNNIVIK